MSNLRSASFWMNRHVQLGLWPLLAMSRKITSQLKQHLTLRRNFIATAALIRPVIALSPKLCG